jgi:hypothetical protein
VHTQNFSFGAGDADPEAVYNLCLILNNYVVKVMP